jgi:hypothetical protein
VPGQLVSWFGNYVVAELPLATALPMAEAWVMVGNSAQVVGSVDSASMGSFHLAVFAQGGVEEVYY